MRFFLISAVFHYLGPAFAVLLFAQVEPLGVAWLRIASAAMVFALWRRPWRDPFSKVEIMLGLTLAGMNSVFYLAIARLPLATVGAIEFLAPIALAALGIGRHAWRRNLAALGLAVVGVLMLTPVSLAGGGAAGFALALANCGLFALYIVLGKRVGGIDGLARAMLIAAAASAPIGFSSAATAFGRPELLAAAVGVGLCSSVIPYVCDQLAMARMSRATFAFMLCLLPALATAIGLVVLRQAPRPAELAGIALVICAVALKSGRNHGVRPIRNIRPEGVSSVPGHDELRQQVPAAVAPR